ncbi:MAG: hypothetical protein ACPGGL_02615 [Phycisphaerales bacterium]
MSVKFQPEYDQGMVYDLSDPIPELPELPGQVEVCPDADVAAERLLTDFRHQADCCVRAFGDCRVTRALVRCTADCWWTRCSACCRGARRIFGCLMHSATVNQPRI